MQELLDVLCLIKYMLYLIKYISLKKKESKRTGPNNGDLFLTGEEGPGRLDSNEQIFAVVNPLQQQPGFKSILKADIQIISLLLLSSSISEAITGKIWYLPVINSILEPTKDISSFSQFKKGTEL